LVGGNSTPDGTRSTSEGFPSFVEKIEGVVFKLNVGFKSSGFVGNADLDVTVEKR
jgi:hypothetical protein